MSNVTKLFMIINTIQSYMNNHYSTTVKSSPELIYMYTTYCIELL